MEFNLSPDEVPISTSNQKDGSIYASCTNDCNCGCVGNVLFCAQIVIDFFGELCCEFTVSGDSCN